MSDPATPRHDVTRLLQEWQDGSRGALDRLIPLVYDELHALASRRLSREWGHRRMQTTAVLDQVDATLVGQRDMSWQNRGHFFAVAAELMRRIVIDHARREGRGKRGGAAMHVELDDALRVSAAAGVDVIDALALDRALQKLERLDPDQGRIGELRFFGGMTVEETADEASASLRRRSSETGRLRKAGCTARAGSGRDGSGA